MRKVLTLVAAVAMVAGCATQAPDVTSYYDQSTGMRTDVMNNELESQGNPREVVWLNAYRTPRSPRTAREQQYYLEFDYMALADAGYLDIPAGASLTLLLDGQAVTFAGSGSANLRREFRQNNNDFVRERAIYPVTRTQLQRIAMARDVKVRVKGKNGLIERNFNKANFERMRQFVNAYAL